MKTTAFLVVAAVSVGLTACGSDDGTTTASVSITSPAAGATVASPVEVAVTASSFVIEPAGEVKAGAGHVHIMVDTDCLATGQSIPKDDTHVHLGDGSASTTLELAAGEHTICVQMADGAHMALDVTAKATFTVS